MYEATRRFGALDEILIHVNRFRWQLLLTLRGGGSFSHAQGVAQKVLG